MLRNINAPFLELLMFEILSFENANIAQQQDVFLELANFIVRSNMPLSSLTLRLLPDFQTELVHNVLQQLPIYFISTSNLRFRRSFFLHWPGQCRVRPSSLYALNYKQSISKDMNGLATVILQKTALATRPFYQCWM